MTLVDRLTSAAREFSFGPPHVRNPELAQLLLEAAERLRVLEASSQRPAERAGQPRAAPTQHVRRSATHALSCSAVWEGGPCTCGGSV